MEHIATKLREIRASRGMSTRQFSKFVGIAQSTLSQYENNTRTPSIENLIKISEATGVDINTIIGTSTPRFPNLDILLAVLNKIPPDEQKKMIEVFKEIVNVLY